MEIVSGRFDFPVGKGPRNQRFTFLFLKPVVAAHVALSGYTAEYVDSDHNLKTLTVMLSARPGAHIDDGYEAYVDVLFNLRDRNADDRFRGTVDFVLFAELQGRIVPAIFDMG